MESVSLASETRHATSTLYLVPPRTDRASESRRLAAPLVGGTERDHTLARRGAHPDLIELAPPQGKERVGIDQIRDAIRSAQFSPVQGDRKVCVLPVAEALTPEAANALLKTLEEPPREMAFVLLAEQATDLLPTIVSRSRVVRLLPTDRADLRAQLRENGYPDAHAEFLIAVADRPGEIDRFFQDRIDVPTLRRDAEERVLQADPVELVSIAVTGESVLRDAALRRLLALASQRDPDLLTDGTRALAGQPRETAFTFLQDLLGVCVRRVRSHDPSGDVSGLLDACVAIDGAHRALSTHAPTEAVFLSLLLALGGIEDGG